MCFVIHFFFNLSFQFYFNLGFLLLFKLSFYPFSSSSVQIGFCSALWGEKAFPSFPLQALGWLLQGARSHLAYYHKIVRLGTKEAVSLMQSKMIWIHFCPLIFCCFFSRSLYWTIRDKIQVFEIDMKSIR